MRAAAGAAETMGKAADEARKAIAETETATRKAFAETVDRSTRALRDEVERLVGGENPELLARLARSSTRRAARWVSRPSSRPTSSAREGEPPVRPRRPDSPFAKQAAALADQQRALTASMDKNHLALVGKVDELAQSGRSRQGGTVGGRQDGERHAAEGRHVRV